MKAIASLLLFAFIALHAAEASAEGALDFADPCKDAEKQFASTTDALKGQADGLIAQWDSRAEPPGELRPLYVEAIRSAAFHTWSEDPTVKALLDTLKKADATFDENSFFLIQIYPKVITEEKEADLVREVYKADYQTKIRPQFMLDRQALDAKIATQKATLDQSCKPDVFNQIFRSTVGRAMLIVSANTEAAKREKGDIAKAVRAVSGISITDIQKYGLLGGENSELRKIASGIVGGEGSELSKAIRALDQVLNPTRWKVDLPTIKIETPKLPKIDPPTVTLPGGRRVCVPWC